MNARVFGLAACVALATVAACTGEDQPVGESMGGATEATAVESAATSSESAATSSESSTVLLPVPTDPTISFSLSFGVGSQNDPPGKEGLAYLTGQMLADASTENRSYEAILEALFPIASSYQVRVDREITTLTGRTHRDNIDLFFELYSDAYLRRPSTRATLSASAATPSTTSKTRCGLPPMRSWARRRCMNLSSPVRRMRIRRSARWRACSRSRWRMFGRSMAPLPSG